MFLALFAPVVAHAEETVIADDEAPVHWAFASLFGTGWYKLGESRSLFVLRIPPRFTLRESFYNERDGRGIGIDLRLPVSLGLHNIDDLPGIIEPDNFGTIAFTPGVEVEIPINESFLLRPFVNLGWGTEISSDYSAWIYHAGVKSRYRFDAGREQLALIGNLYYAGYKPSEGRSDSMTGVALGVEGKHPFRNFSLAGRPMALDWHVIYTYFDNRPVFTPDRDDARVCQRGD